MDSFFMNVRTGEILSYEDFIKIAWDGAKDTSKEFYNVDFEKLSDNGKVVAFTSESKNMINLYGWRLVQD